MSYSVQLSNDYVSKIGKAQLEYLKKQGTLKEIDGKYYLNSTFTVSDECIDSSSNSKGVIFESSPENVKVVSSDEYTTIDINSIKTQLKENKGIELTDEQLNSVKAKIAEQGITIDEDGNITLKTGDNETLNNILAEVLSTNEETPKINNGYIITFNEGTDKEFIATLVQSNIIKDNNDGTHTILDAEKFNSALPVQEQKTETQDINLNIEGNKKTVTVTEENMVNVPENIKTCSRSEKKQLEKEYVDTLRTLDEQSETIAAIVDLAVANAYYGKDISNKIEKLKKENNLYRPEDVVKYYLDNYASGEEAAKVDAIIRNEVSKMTDEELLEFYKAEQTKDGKNAAHITFEGQGGEKLKEKAKYLYAASQMQDWSKDILLNRMGLAEVLEEKEANGKLKKDKEKWFKEQARNQVRTAETEQNIKNTTTYFSEDAAKAAKSSETDKTKIHQDIGDAGRKFVMACPDMFCDTVDDANSADFSVNGTNYKFNQTKWDKWCSDQVNTWNEKGYGKDNHGTLDELRTSWLGNVYVTADGDSKTLEQIIGNDNGKVGNSELNKFRHIIESSGRTVDNNNTILKRVGSVLKDVGIAYGLGFLTAGVGSAILGEAIKVGATATATATATASAGGYTYEAYTDPETHEITVQIDNVVNGEHNPATYIYTVTDDPELIPIDVPEEIVTAESTETSSVNVSKKSNPLKVGHKAGTMTAIFALPGAVYNSSKVDDQGTANGRDAVIADLTIRRTEESEAEQTTVNCSFKVNKPIFTVSGEKMKTKEVEYVKKKPVAYRSHEAYTLLYQTEDGKEIYNNPENKKINAAVKQALMDEWQVGYGQWPEQGLWFPKQITVTVNGKEITVKLKDNWEDVYDNKDGNGIRVGTSGDVTDSKKTVNVPKEHESVTLQASGTVRTAG